MVPEGVRGDSHLWNSIHQCQVRHSLKLLARRNPGRRQYLDQENSDHLLLRIDPETRPRRAAPIIFSLRTHGGVLARSQIDSERQAKTVPFRQQSRASQTTEMIAAH